MAISHVPDPLGGTRDKMVSQPAAADPYDDKPHADTTDPLAYAHDSWCNTDHVAGPHPCPPAGSPPRLPEPLATVTVEPGDVLVVVLPAHTTREQFDRLLAVVDEQKSPNLKGRLLFVAGVEGLAVIKAEQSAE